MSLHQPITAEVCHPDCLPTPDTTVPLFTPELIAALAALPPADRAMHIQIIAQSHHYRTYPILGVWDSLSGVPQMRAWARDGERLTAEAEAEFARILAARGGEQ